MNPVDRASELIRKTEAELRRLVVEAASGGDYASVVQVAAWARSLSEMAGLLRGPASDAAELGARPTHLHRPPNSRTRRSDTKTEYPRFLRHGERLVRVSWSKRERKEYQHKAPASVLTSLVERIIQKGADGRLFSTDELIPMTDRDGIDVPNYQVYAALSLLRHVGLLDQHGRQGYSVPRPSDFRTEADAIWESLPEK